MEREIQMAKCVKSKRNGNIIRVSDEEAARLVKESDFAYAPKAFAKACARTNSGFDPARFLAACDYCEEETV